MFKKLSEKRRGGDGGFTLIELLVVIVILGILAGVVVFAVGGITDKGEVSACKADAKTLRIAEETSFAQGDGYQAEAALVPLYLSEESEMHDITVPGAGGEPYTIDVVDCP